MFSFSEKRRNNKNLNESGMNKTFFTVLSPKEEVWLHFSVELLDNCKTKLIYLLHIQQIKAVCDPTWGLQ